MAGQRVFFSWKDDDLTFDINRRTLGLIDAGLYRGYDAVLAAGLSLQLNHLTTGGTEVDLNLVVSSKFGIVVTKQGSIVREEDPVLITVPTNLGNLQRIDTIYLEHEYITVPGGAAATYGIVQGTPAFLPVAPAVPFPNKQIILGYLYMPANAASLTAPGVIYTRVESPTFASDPFTMFLNKVQTSTAHKTFQSIAGIFKQATISATGSPSQVFISCNAPNAGQTPDGNYFEIPNVSNDYKKVLGISSFGNINSGYSLFFTTQQKLLIQPTTGTFLCGGDIHLEPGDSFWAISIGGNVTTGAYSFAIVANGDAQRGSYNKWLKLQADQYDTTEVVGAGSQNFNHNYKANFFDVDNANFGVSTMRQIRSAFTLGSDNFTPSSVEGGTKIIMRFNAAMTIVHASATPPLPDYKNIETPTIADWFLDPGIIEFTETPTAWVVTNYITANANPYTANSRITQLFSGKADKVADSWHKVGDPSEPTLGGGYNPPIANQGIVFQKTGINSVHLVGIVFATGSVVANADLVFTLPVGYRLSSPPSVFPKTLIREAFASLAGAFNARVSVNLSNGEVRLTTTAGGFVPSDIYYFDLSWKL